MHPTARDFGSLIPYIKSYSRDLIPDIDPGERVAILRKDGSIRLSDYCKTIPEVLTFGLSWHTAMNLHVDLDASVICLDAHLRLVDTVWHNQLESKDGSIRHGGDDKCIGDEKIRVNLSTISPEIRYIGFTVDSSTGEELSDIDRASCHGSASALKHVCK
jgi:stress response protein SCP2